MRIILKIITITLLPFTGLAALFLFCGGSEVGNPKTITGRYAIRPEHAWRMSTFI